MKKTIGIFAHVDAGKTTLSERLLFKTNVIRKVGRVDDRNTTLDHGETERQRGITVFSDVADFVYNDTTYYLVDTPGHTDFSPQAERALSVIDYAILVISATDGVQSHTKTLWNVLEKHHKPVLIFINKSDMETADKNRCLAELNQVFGDCLDFTKDVSEDLALYDDALLESYTEHPTDLRFSELVVGLVRQRKLFPCFYGSALADQGIDFFLSAMDRLTQTAYDSSGTFSACVFKVRHTEDGSRVCFLKVLSGTLAVKDRLTLGDKVEKINEIRLYTGGKYRQVQRASAGDICAVCGLSRVAAGSMIGAEQTEEKPVFIPAMQCAVYYDSNISSRDALSALRILEDEEPTLSVDWNEELKDLQVQIMGTIQQEILADELARRFHMNVTFGDCKIMYRETIAAPVYGFGHFEPLRHYAEVHLKLSPGERGSGVAFQSALSVDSLEKQYQHLIKTHVFETKHLGALVGAPITDVVITLINGKAYDEHTTGGDFREATYRAIRQGLFSAQSVLLEPVYEFEIIVPQSLCGKVIADMQRMYGVTNPPEQLSACVRLTGRVPVATAMGYPTELASASSGTAGVNFRVAGYQPCHNADDVISRIGYEKERDIAHPADSVFVARGSSYIVPWHQMEQAIHLEKPPALS